jgi:O-antigen ligase
MLAFAIYLLLHQLVWGGIKGLQRWVMLALAGLMIVNIFITKGRVGQLVFFMLMALLLFQYFRRNMLKAALLVLVLLPLVFTAAYRFSPVFQDRMDAIQQNLLTFEKNPDTPVGLRLLFWKNSWEIIKTSPWFGVGTGDFNSAYSQINQQASPDIPSTDNPHNQYILVGVQLGLFGLVSLLGLFFTQIYQAVRITDGWERIRLAFPLFFLTIMLTDSYLNTYGSAFLFSLFSAVFFKSKLSWQAQPVPPSLVVG